MWIGDDAAVLAGGTLFATDMLVEGVHFDLAWGSPEDVGWKALAVNVSDIAAMGGTPRAAVAAVAVPPNRGGLADGLLEGLAEAAGRLACPLVGGDTSQGSDVVVSVSVIGDAPPSGPVLRSGARPGDLVFVTGALGGSAVALRALRSGDAPDVGALGRLRRPWPRVDAGRAAAAAGATAMIDVSDGLASELRHLCADSAVGVIVDEVRIPLGPGAEIDDAFGGGDEYELLFGARDPAAVVDAFRDAGLPEPVAIGEFVPEGSGQPIPDTGWEHDVP